MNRPRSDLFMQHLLSSRQGRDIPITHLFVEYRHWIERQEPFSSVRDELATLARQREDFRRLIDPAKHDPLARLSRFLQVFDVSTAFPLLLALLDTRPQDEQIQAIGRVIESYLLRRAVCDLGTKGYNRIFLQVLRALKGELTAEALAQHLLTLGGESAVWPRDEQFREAWTTKNLYQSMNNPRIVYILRRLNDALLSQKAEEVTLEIDSPLTVEHLLPQDWVSNWPLAEGVPGMRWNELAEAAPEDVRADATRVRNRALQTIGNLTILGQSLNSAVSNSAWEVKKPELLKHSLLPINQQLHAVQTWDESAIIARGLDLFERAKTIWQIPAAP